MMVKLREWEISLMEYHQAGGFEVMSDNMKKTYFRNVVHQ